MDALLPQFRSANLLTVRLSIRYTPEGYPYRIGCVSALLPFQARLGHQAPSDQGKRTSLQVEL